MNGLSVPTLGVLRDRLQLIRRVYVEQGADQFTPIAAVWGRQQKNAFVIRFREDIVTGDRVVLRGKTYDITSCEDLNGRKAYLVMHAAPAEQESV